jgi:hypothetical protein
VPQDLHRNKLVPAGGIDHAEVPESRLFTSEKDRTSPPQVSSVYRLVKFGGRSESSSSWTAMFVISARTCQGGLPVRT